MFPKVMEKGKNRTRKRCACDYSTLTSPPRGIHEMDKFPYVKTMSQGNVFQNLSELTPIVDIPFANTLVAFAENGLKQDSATARGPAH